MKEPTPDKTHFTQYVKNQNDSREIIAAAAARSACFTLPVQSKSADAQVPGDAIHAFFDQLVKVGLIKCLRESAWIAMGIYCLLYTSDAADE